MTTRRHIYQLLHIISTNNILTIFWIFALFRMHNRLWVTVKVFNEWAGHRWDKISNQYE